MSASRAYIWLSVVVTIVSGTFSAVATKALYQLKTDGLCGENTFSKAYMTTLWMFIGEALCLVYYFADRWWKSFRGTELKSETEQAVKKPPLWNFVVLSLFDLSATAIGGVGLFWVTASANQMLRGSAVLFTGIFTFLILKRRLATRKWIGIGVVICGLVLVGGSAALQAHIDEQNGKSNSDNDLNATPSQAILGVVLVLVGSALNSAQGVFEEKLMKGTDIDPLEVVGWEGVSGMILCSFALLPITEAIPGSDCGSAESTTDSLLQMHRNPLIVGLLVLFAVSLAFMNYFSQVISKHLSAVHRMLINTLRTVLVWVVSIMLFYVFTHESFGEPWVVTSYMQLGGFALLIIGTFVYGMTAEVDKKAEGDDATTRLVAPDAIVPSDTDADEETGHDYAYSHSYQNGKAQDSR